jgi:DNA-binding transcriptional LysR family regulator
MAEDGDMELNQLQVVKGILETGSVSKTAIRLHRSKSVISRQLAALEHECGGRLFYRNGRGLLLTELGESILPQVELILSAANDIMSCKATVKNDLSGEVRLATTPAVGPILVERLFGALRGQYPAIRLRVSESFSAEIQSDLQDGRTDVAVFLRNGAGVGRADRVICEFDTFLVGLPSDPLLRQNEIPFSALHELPLLMPTSPSLARQSFEDAAIAKGIKLTVVANLNTTGPTMALVRAGAGYLVTPMGPAGGATMSYIGAEVRAGQLRAVRIVEPRFTRTLTVCTSVNPKHSVEAVAQQAVSILRDTIGAPLQGQPTAKERK